MKILKPLTEKDFVGKGHDELIDMLTEEVKYFDKTEIAKILTQLRSSAIEDQKTELKGQMQAEIDKQLKLLEILQCKTKPMIKREVAYGKVLKFMQEHEMILSPEFLVESVSLLDFLLTKKDSLQAEHVRDFDYIMKKRAEIYESLLPQDQQTIKTLGQEKFVEIMIKLDAKFDMDRIAQSHIRSAIKSEYGKLKKADIKFYREMYLDFKKEYEDVKGI